MGIMEFSKRSDGKTRFTAEQKRLILDEVSSGGTPAAVARKYGIRIQNIYSWRRLWANGGPTALKSNEPVVPVSELKKAYEEIQRLQKALGKMTLKRDILKEAQEIVKKKWLSPGN
jgi:transposase-like protein